ncbi:branched-chain amino acid aminotransferase [Umbelopsis sp. AD052]|nr:branched-chain amino acid aminotransferase [Umbelopsis sp. AD052]
MSNPTTPPTDKLDWQNIGFQYRDINGYAKYTWTPENGWDEGSLETNPYLNVHMCSTGLNYGQECFEGLKAFRTKDGRIRVFRPHENGKRMNLTAAFGSMPGIPEEIFLEAIKKTVQANLEFVPPYGSGGSLYLRPLLFGSGPMIGLSPAPEFTFIVFGVPVGNYYKDGVKPVDACIIEDFDRSAPLGTGSFKLGGNYAPVFLPTEKAKKQGFPITLHLDSKTHTYVDEFSTSNFVALSNKDGVTTLVTPNGRTILRSVTRISLVEIARDLGWTVEERDVPFSEIEEGKFDEIAACGTAAVITPVKTISRGEKSYNIGSGEQTEIGAGFNALYKQYKAIQNGDVADTKGWMWPAEGF